MVVVGAPMPGDVLQAQKGLKPQKEIHGKGFEEIFKEAIWREKQKTIAEGARSASDAEGITNTESILYVMPAEMSGTNI